MERTNGRASSHPSLRSAKLAVKRAVMLSEVLDRPRRHDRRNRRRLPVLLLDLRGRTLRPIACLVERVVVPPLLLHGAVGGSDRPLDLVPVVVVRPRLLGRRPAGA